jgi:hypothetical protein
MPDEIRQSAALETELREAISDSADDYVRLCLSTTPILQNDPSWCSHCRWCPFLHLLPQRRGCESAGLRNQHVRCNKRLAVESFFRIHFYWILWLVCECIRGRHHLTSDPLTWLYTWVCRSGTMPLPRKNVRSVDWSHQLSFNVEFIAVCWDEVV